MRVLLRQKDSGLYYAGGLQWTPAPTRALDFGAVETALQWRQEQNLTQTEVVLDHEHPGLRSRYTSKENLSKLKFETRSSKSETNSKSE